MRAGLILGAIALLSAPAFAQKVSAPTGARGVAGTAVHSLGNATATVPAAHEVGAQVLAPTVPAAQPFAAGVTTGTAAISSGISKTGDNIAKNGVNAYPTNSIGNGHQGYQAKAAKNAVTQAQKAIPKPEQLKCDAQELATGECQ